MRLAAYKRTNPPLGLVRDDFPANDKDSDGRPEAGYVHALFSGTKRNNPNAYTA